jgi:hypothetical protein
MQELPICAATVLDGRIQPVYGEWVASPARRPHYLMPTTPVVKWMIPCRSAAYGGQAPSAARWNSLQQPVYAIERSGAAGGDKARPWREWGDPPPPRVPPRTQWEWRAAAGCALRRATRTRLCALLVRRRTHVLFLGDSRQRIMAYSLYKMLGGAAQPVALATPRRAPSCWRSGRLHAAQIVPEPPGSARRRLRS